MSMCAGELQVLLIDQKAFRRAGFLSLLENWAQSSNISVKAVAPDAAATDSEKLTSCHLVLLSLGSQSINKESTRQLIQLLRTLSDNGIMDFNEAATRAERRELETARRNATGEVFHISDDSDTHITIKLGQYQRAGTNQAINNFTKQFRWRNLKSDIKRFPGSASMTKAGNAAAVLEAMTNHQALQRLP